MHDLNRYLKQPKGRRVWMYQRGVPERFKGADARYKTITKSTGKRDIYEARQVRDQLEEADNQYWAALDAGLSAETAQEKYDAALAMRTAKGTTWLVGDSYGEIIEGGELSKFEDTVNQTWRDVTGKNIGQLSREELNRAHPIVETILAGTLGTVDAPEPNFREEVRIWVEEMICLDWKGKSREQLRQWRNPIDRAVKNFEKVVGSDHPFLKTTRAQATQFFQWHNRRIIAGEITSDTGRRDIGILRKVWRARARFHGIDAPNPFRDLSWPRSKKKRPTFSDEWICTKFLSGDGLHTLNEQARRAFLALIETGCRPSELINLQSENIHVDEAIPHIHIRSMPGREIKNQASARRIPLVGVALAVFRQQPDGFPRYIDKDSSFSGVLNKYLRDNELRESSKHTVYGLRHSFETRMKASRLDLEMRKQLMGHSLDRPDYGEGFSLEHLQEALNSMALPYDPAVV
jgi:integrase